MVCWLPLLLGGALATPDEPPEILWLAKNALANEDVVSLSSGLQYRILRSGPAVGPHPTPSTQCECHYKGTLTDGTEFDSSYRRGKPSTFSPNRVIPGWTEALQLMRPGDKWELFVPPFLGYGSRGSPPRIPPKAVLIFTLELISIDTTSKWTFFGIDFSQPYTIAVAVALGYVLMRLLSGGGGAKGPRVSVDEASDDSNHRVFFDMSIGGQKAGRIEMELFNKVGLRGLASPCIKRLVRDAGWGEFLGALTRRVHVRRRGSERGACELRTDLGRMICGPGATPPPRDVRNAFVLCPPAGVPKDSGKLPSALHW